MDEEFQPMSREEFFNHESRGQGDGSLLEQQTALHLAKFSGVDGVVTNDYYFCEIDNFAVLNVISSQLCMLITCRDHKTAINECELWKTASICQRMTQENKKMVVIPGISFSNEEEGLSHKAIRAAKYHGFIQISPYFWDKQILGRLEYYNNYEPDHVKRLKELEPHLNDVRIMLSDEEYKINKTRSPETVKRKGVNPRLSDLELEEFRSYNGGDLERVSN